MNPWNNLHGADKNGSETKTNIFTIGVRGVKIGNICQCSFLQAVWTNSMQASHQLDQLH